MEFGVRFELDGRIALVTCGESGMKDTDVGHCKRAHSSFLFPIPRGLMDEWMEGHRVLLE